MVLFFILTVALLGLIPLIVFLWKKKGKKGGAAFLSIVVGVFMIINLTSVIYHAAGNERTYQERLARREALTSLRQKVTDHEEIPIYPALGPNKQNYDEPAEVERLIHDFNLALDHEKGIRENVFLSWYGFQYSLDHYDDLRIPE